MTFAVLRLRSSVNNNRRTEDTLKGLRLTRVNHCTIIDDNPEIKGMLKRVKDIVTWGEIEPETLSKMLTTKANINEGLTDDFVKEYTEYETVDEFAKAVVEGKEKLESIDGLKNLFRMHPPIGGYRGIKKTYNTGGSLGYRGKEINNLLERMLGPAAEKK